jgi:GTPase SAR1 family protein
MGKTSLVRGFVESLFDASYHKTVGVKIDKKLHVPMNSAVALLPKGITQPPSMTIECSLK